MRTLIIGSSGFLGTTLYKYLATTTDYIHVLNRKIDASIKCKQYLINDIEKINPDFDCVFFLAAHIPYNNKSTDDVKVNVELAGRVANQFKNCKIIYSSSVSVYGNATYTANEEHQCSPITTYAKSKLDSERIISTCKNNIILRFSSIYGPKMTAPTFIPKIAECAINTNEIKVFDPQRMQDYIYIEDAVKMLHVSSYTNAGGIFNAVSGVSHSNLQIAEIVANNIANVNIVNCGGDSLSHKYSRDKWDATFKINTITNISDGIKNYIRSINLPKSEITSPQ